MDRPEPTPGWPAPSRRVRRVLVATEWLLSAFCLASLGLAGLGVARGEVPAGSLAVLGVLGLVVVLPAVLSRRAGLPPRLEAARAGLGLVVAPVAYLLVGGALADWWPAFLVLALASIPVLGLVTHGPRWGRAVTGAHVLGIAAAGAMSGALGFAFVTQLLVVGVVSLLLVEVVAELDRSLTSERQKSEELAAARDALLTEVEAAQEVQTLLFSEMEVAQRIQTLLLPRRPRVPDHEVVGRMITASEVGGDYYDVLDCDARCLFAIGDVSGHGLTSGLTMMMARTSLVGAVEATPAASLVELYQVLNRCMRQNLERMDLSMYMTFALVEYQGEGHFNAIGRHLPMLIWRRETGRIDEVDLQGIWLGVLDDLGADQLPEARFRLGAGDLLFLYTDGVVEQFANDEMFGFERLKDVIRRHAAAGPQVLVDEVLRSLADFSPEHEDDVTMLVLNHVGDVAALGAS